MALKDISKDEKKTLEKLVGEDLVKNYGKQQSYSAKQVQESAKRSNYDIDFHCWAMCFYCDKETFDSFHQAIGESCDYVNMKMQMISALTEGASDSWLDFDFDTSWIDLPDFDFGDFFVIF